MQLMPTKIIAAIDRSRYPSSPKCVHCEGDVGHTEEVWTGNTDGENYSGWEVWFCCHKCRDKDEPCESFYPIRLKLESTV